METASFASRRGTPTVASLVADILLLRDRWLSGWAKRRTNAPYLCNQASYVSLVASVHRSCLHAPDRRASIIDAGSAGSMCDMPQARHSKV
jgi:hypothetical protein